MAAVDYYLKIDGVDGESTKKGVENHIEVLSWSWGETNTGSMSHGTGGGTGRISMQDFSFTMTINKATPKLLLACATGEHIKSALLTCREAGKEQHPYLKIKFTDLLISSYQIGGARGDDHKPVDHVSFNYSKIEIEYHAQKQDGTLDSPVKAGYDLKKLEKV
jgi:type VI secretion system secreted protein Hcp